MYKYNMEIYTKEILKPVNSNFERRRVKAGKIHDIWSCDLVDMIEFSDVNNEFNYMLNIVDVFSKYAWIIPLKTKGSKEVVEAFEPLFKEFKPLHIWVDNGKEFYNKEMTKLIKKYNVNRYSTYSEHKSAVVERFNRTIKNIVWRHFLTNQTRNWVDVIDKIVNDYNNRKHSTIKMKPIEALRNEEKVREIYSKKDIQSFHNEPVFKVGDFVRISRVKGVFEKGYNPNWSSEVYVIKKVNDTDPITYNLDDKLGESLEGSFYTNELQKTKIPDFALVEKVIKRRTYKGEKQAFVKYIGYDEKFNSWINESDTLINFV